MGSPFNRIAATVAVACLGLPVFGAAQTIPSPFEYLERRQEAGIFSGVHGAGTGRFGYAPSGGPMFGARYGLELSGPLGLEGTISFIDSERDVIDPSQIEANRVIGRTDQLLTTIDARIRFSFAGRRMWKRLSPFLTMGGGAVIGAGGDDTLDQTLLAEDVFSFGSSFYGNLGLGTRWFMTDQLALRADGLFSLWKVDTPPGFSDPGRAFSEVEDGEWLRGTGFSLALLWRW
ncbi:MAG: hypothetical protein L7S64_10390 [Longimicrobiales bacterium]|nr:hypothetical protein [Longimicrobiales bacterium]